MKKERKKYRHNQGLKERKKKRKEKKKEIKEKNLSNKRSINSRLLRCDTARGFCDSKSH